MEIIDLVDLEACEGRVEQELIVERSSRLDDNEVFSPKESDMI